MLIPTFSPVSNYKIERSLRFNSADSAKLQRAGTLSTADTITVSGWVKGVPDTGNHPVLGDPVQTSSSRNIIGFSSGQMIIQSLTSSGTTTTNFLSAALFRDPSAWYHCVWVFDGGNATAADRQIFYVNGVRLIDVTGTRGTAFSNNWPGILSTLAIGAWEVNSVVQYSSFQLAELHVIDGVATADDFGKFDANGVWAPKAVTIDHGTGGFYLNFSDNSAATAAAIGADSSGNGFNFTPTNISVTAGVGNDSLVDSPTNYGTDSGLGGQVRGNYCTMSPLWNNSHTISNGNLTVTGAGGSNDTAAATMALSGKMYFEDTVTSHNTTTGGRWIVGVINENHSINFTTSTNMTSTGAYGYSDLGQPITNGTGGAAITALNTGDVVGVAVDVDNGKMWISINGTFVNSGDPANGTNPTVTGVTGDFLIPAINAVDSNEVHDLNFGQRPFANTAPSGFKALCTQNLSAPTVKKPSDYFDVATYTGTGANKNIVVAFQPNIAWIKRRDAAASHHIVDSDRGAAIPLFSDLTAAEDNRPLSVTSFNADGISLGDSSDGNVNLSGGTYVAWLMAQGATPGFDVVTYTGDGSNTGTVAHALGTAPKFIIIKNRDAAKDWPVWVNTSSGTKTAWLDLNTGLSSSRFYDAGMTSTTFGVSNSFGDAVTNGSGVDYIAYVWAEIPGFSKFDIYTANGDADGPFIWCGFKPRWVMVKRLTSTGSWIILDTERDPFNLAQGELAADLSNAENSVGALNQWDILSNGFKLRNTGTDINASGSTYIFAAFAEAPFKYARAQ